LLFSNGTNKKKSSRPRPFFLLKNGKSRLEDPKVKKKWERAKKGPYGLGPVPVSKNN
jgi:hypothetical protein